MSSCPAYLIYLSIYGLYKIYLSIYKYNRLSIYVFVCLFIYECVLPIYFIDLDILYNLISTYIYSFNSLSLLFFPPIYLLSSIFLFCLSIYLFIYLFLNLSILIYTSILLFIISYIYSSIHLSIFLTSYLFFQNYLSIKSLWPTT